MMAECDYGQYHVKILQIERIAYDRSNARVILELSFGSNMRRDDSIISTRKT